MGLICEFKPQIEIVKLIKNRNNVYKVDFHIL